MSNAAPRTTTEETSHDRCLIKPMSGENGDPLIKPVRVVDAAIVAGVVFFSLLLGSTLPQLLSTGSVEYITLVEIRERGLTAAVAFFLTFFAQWARYRGIRLKQWMNGDGGE